MAPAWVTEVSAMGSLPVAIVALFGEKLRNRLLPPKLIVEKVDDEGDLVPQTITWQDESGARQQHQRDARYYYLRVTNTRRLISPAHDVQVVIESVETPGPNAQPVQVFRGPLPLTWRHGHAYPPARTIGPVTECDFLVATAEPSLGIMASFAPNNLTVEYPHATRMWLTVPAHASECDSDPVRFEVAWDGKWDRGEAEMKMHHLTITPAP
jgi:hypothetical protein